MTQPHQCPSCLQYWQPYEELAGVHTCSGYQPVISDPRDAEVAKLREELAEARRLIERLAQAAINCEAEESARAFLARKEAK